MLRACRCAEEERPDAFFVREDDEVGGLEARCRGRDNPVLMLRACRCAEEERPDAFFVREDDEVGGLEARCRGRDNTVLG
jgi:nitrite reductase/ring-hydroxylating ferredoxin subunit